MPLLLPLLLLLTLLLLPLLVRDLEEGGRRVEVRMRAVKEGSGGERRVWRVGVWHRGWENDAGQ